MRFSCTDESGDHARDRQDWEPGPTLPDSIRREVEEVLRAVSGALFCYDNRLDPVEQDDELRARLEGVLKRCADLLGE